jgi:poly(3-hydroxybutyrate) depolymerase
MYYLCSQKTELMHKTNEHKGTGTLCIIITILLSLTLQASAYKQQSINITVNNQKRNMVVFTPDEFPAKSPLFIVTHGMNQDPEYQYGSDKMYEMIDTAKFVITYLRSDGSMWDTGGTKDQNFVIKAIDEMASRFDIDRERVYWSGFSMGSMLIHHCIAAMQDKIAAFAPTSGIQFSESPWTKCKKPVNLLECIAYGDDVFGYEQYGIHGYIENYAKHDKHTQYSKTTGYRPVNGSWFDGDLERWTGGSNGGEVWLYSYNNGGHWPMDLNRHLIWNFCKRFSLNQPSVSIAEPAGETTHLYLAPKKEATFPDITVEATAKAQNGEIVKAEFFDGDRLVETLTSAPFRATLPAPAAGKHHIRVAVTDDKGKTAETSCLFNCDAPEASYDLSQRFTVEGIVPQDWCVSNGSSERIGGGLPFASGPRILHFTNATRGFEYGLLVQNTAGKEKGAWAKFGVGTARSTMTLRPGRYALKYRLYNWNRPEFSPVTIAIESADGQTVASKSYTPTRNIGGNAGNAFSGIRTQTFEFEISQTDNYVIAFYADAEKNADFVLGVVSIQAKEFAATGIRELPVSADRPSVFYDLSGRRLQIVPQQPGIYIINGRKTVVK